jgi:hypothetical protein
MRNISEDLSQLTATEIVARWMNEDTYQWLLAERAKLISRLNDASVNSRNTIEEELSLISAVIDRYECIHLKTEAA